MFISVRTCVLPVVLGAVCLETREALAQEQERPEPVQQSAWGEPVNGLQLRATFPNQIEQGKELTPAVEFRCDVSRLPPNVKALNPYDACTYFRLLLVNLETEDVTGIDAETRTYGPGGYDVGRFAHPLDGALIEVSRPRFATLVEGTPLPPGRYRALLRYRQPPEPNPSWHGTKEEWDARGFWSGKVESPPIEIEFAGAIERTEAIYVPLRIRVLKVLQPGCPQHSRPPRLDPDFFHIVTYLFEEAEQVVVPRRNGHWMGHRVDTSDGGWLQAGGPPFPGDRTGLDQLHRYQNRGGDADYMLTVTVFETCADNPRFVGPRSCGYKVLWEKAFPVKYSAAEMAAAPELPWRGPP